MSSIVELICLLDIEQTAESFHAHAIPEGAEPGPGDVITVHDAPAAIGFGECYTGSSRATLQRAGAVRRLWTQFSSFFELTELFEVGFSPKEYGK
jgi:hypothetical protein